MKSLLIHFLLLVVALVLSYLTMVSPIGQWLFDFYRTGGWGDYAAAIGILLMCYLFWNPVLFLGFGKGKVFLIWLAITFLPPAIFVFDSFKNDKLYLPVSIAIAGFIAGYLVLIFKKKYA